MPTARFWEFEDAAVDFEDLGAAPEELAKLLLIEFPTVYGNDHFIGHCCIRGDRVLAARLPV